MPTQPATDPRELARQLRDDLPVDPRWPRAGDWPAFESLPDDERVQVALIGVGTHATSLSPTQAHATPAAVRQALARYSPHAEGLDDRVAGVTVADAGDLADPDANEDAATATIARIASRADLVIALGGDNAATVPAMLGSAGPELATAGLVTLDAHYDLRDGQSNGSPVARLVAAGLDPQRIVQIGIQDFANSASYARQARDWGITVIRREECETTPMAELAARALAIAGAAGGPIHLDVDVDVCDRSVAPGCPAAAPGGISAWQLRSFIRAFVADPRVTSIDFTEVDATTDTPDQRTVRLVALGVLEAIAAVASRGLPAPRTLS